MTLFFSDVHLGREPEGDRERLATILACVRYELNGRGNSLLDDGAEQPSIIFLGDTFDAFVDTPRRMPPIAHAWMDLVKELRNLGAAVRFFSGNHDRWHAGNLERHAGIRPDRGPAYLPHPRAKVLVSHGDEADHLPPHERFIKWLSDTRAAHAAYRTVLPFGAAQRVAAWASARLATVGPGDARATASHEQTVNALRRSAMGYLEKKRAQVVVYGHAHRAELTAMHDGLYLNTGDWYLSRTYGVLAGTHARLVRWKAGEPSPDTLAEHVLF